MEKKISTLILFDIDLTLVDVGGDGLRAMSAALRQMTDYQGEITPVRFHGLTDPLIVPALFKANGLKWDDSQYDPFMECYLTSFHQLMSQQTHWKILPGVERLVRKLHEMPSVFLGLVTGNHERGARIKLGAFGLNGYFPVGGFASDSASRTEMIHIAKERAEAYFRESFRSSQIILVGDSELDVASAQEAQTHCLAVKTGHTDEDTLKTSGPCLIIENLADTKLIFSLFARMADGFRSHEDD